MVPSSKQPLILLVEDDQVDRLAVERSFGQEDLPYRLVTVATLAEALEVLEQGGVDLAIIDVMLPDGTGLDVQEHMGETPVIFTTGVSNINVAVHAMKAGAYDYLIKDANREYLNLLPIAIENALQRKRDTDELVEYRQHLEELVDQRTSALRESEMRWRSLAENSPDRITLLDTEAMILSTNNAGPDLSPEQVVGRSAFDFIPPEFHQVAKDCMQRVLETGEADSYDMALRTENGKARHFEVRVWPIEDDDQITALLTNSRDVTDLVQSEETTKRLAQILEDSLYGIFVAEAETLSLSFVNRGARENLGYSLAELQSLTPLDLAPEFTAETLAELLQPLRDGTQETIVFETSLRRKDGSSYPVETHLQLISDQQQTNLVAMTKDITERKIMDEQLRRSHEAVELLYEAGKELGKSLDLDTICDNLHRVVSKVMTCDGMVVSSFDHKDEMIRCVGFWHEGNKVDASDFPPIPLEPPGQGTQSRVIHSGESLYLEDFQADVQTAETSYLVDGEGVKDIGEEAGNEDITRSALIVPIKRENTIVGVIQVFSYRMNDFSEEDMSFLEALAPQVAAATTNAHLYGQTERRLRRLTALRTIDMAITSSVDMKFTLDIILEQLVSQLNITAADILLLDPGTQYLSFAAGRGFRSDALQHTMLRMGDGYAGQAALERKIVKIPDINIAPYKLERSRDLPMEGFVAYVGVPMIVKGQVLGVMEVFHREELIKDEGWYEFLETLAGQAAIAIDNATLFENLERSNFDLVVSYDRTLEGWATTLELRDKDTEGHTQRVADQAVKLARTLGLDDDDIVHLRRGALLHDIGKMGIPDDVMLKPGPLSEDEWVVMRKHPEYAYDMISSIPFLRKAIDIPYCHHEKWDGTGYPRGMSGEQIPLAARIFAVIDVWDALTSDRPYRKAWKREKALNHIREQAGIHFDPQVAEIFLEMTA